MLSTESIGLMHALVAYLLEPVVWALLLLTLLSVLDVGIAVSERVWGLSRWQAPNLVALEKLAHQRIQRSDLMARIAPMLGLMGTLIPLGPGLSALGSGDLSVLTTAMSVAFDTTVLGLLVGIVGFILGRLRRQWYESRLTQLEQAHG